MKQDQLPLGFSMALAMNPDAMQAFVGLNEEQKQAVLAQTKAIQSREQMRRFVSELANGKK